MWDTNESDPNEILIVVATGGVIMSAYRILFYAF